MGNKRITEKDKLILKLLTEEFLTTKKVSIRLKITTQAVNKHIRKLREKGLLKGNSYRGFQKPNISHMGGFQYRLHDMELKLTTKQPTKHRKRVDFYKGARFHIYTQSIRIWQGQRYFYGESVKLIYQQAWVFWQNMIDFIENKYKLHTDTLETSHIGEIENVNCPMGAKVIEDKQRWQFRGKDGKVWLITDKSMNMQNSETTHSISSDEDAKLVFENIYNSWKYKEAFTPKEATNMIGQLIQERKYYADHQTLHTKELKGMTSVLKELKKELLQEKKQKRRLSEEWGW